MARVTLLLVMLLAVGLLVSIASQPARAQDQYPASDQTQAQAPDQTQAPASDQTQAESQAEVAPPSEVAPAAPAPSGEYPNVSGITPFTAASNYMSVPGYLRWQTFESQGVWLTYAEARRIVIAQGGQLYHRA